MPEEPHRAFSDGFAFFYCLDLKGNQRATSVAWWQWTISPFPAVRRNLAQWNRLPACIWYMGLARKETALWWSIWYIITTIIKEDTVFIETTADMNTVSHQDQNNFTELSAKLSLADSSSLSSEFGLFSAITPGDDESRHQNFLTDGVDWEHWVNVLASVPMQL